MNATDERPLNLVAACAFGLEAIVKRELIALGYEPHVVQPGRVRFAGDWLAVCRTNLWLRTADRVLIEVQQFPAADFEALFETVKAFDWSSFIPADGEFPVIGKTRLSKLTSLPAVQRATKKAIVESLQHFHGKSELPESGELFKVEVALLSDVATITIDTTGESLHKRGYRKLNGPAPIKQTLAAAMIELSVWKPERPLIDPFCGSGTIAIEAALVGMNLAPGLPRDFASSRWHHIAYETWIAARDEAKDLHRRDQTLQIVASDSGEEAISMARYHARIAGVERHIEFVQQPFDQTASNLDYGCIITNPPYGQRLEDERELIPLYEQFPAVMSRLPTWSLYVITSVARFEKIIQRRADRRRKLFNGRLECTYFQLLGPRPPRGYFDDLPPQPRLDTSEARDAGPEITANQSQESISTSVATDRETEARSEPAFASLASQLGGSARPIQQSPTAQTAASGPAIEVVTHGGGEAVSETRPDASPQPERPAQQTDDSPVFGGLQPKDYEQAEIFASRLKKRARHLRRWPTRRGITCFRIYERDVPEIPLVVDRYEEALHITEYERPHERSLSRHEAWLMLMKETAGKTLDVPQDQVFFKRRSRNRDGDQYLKVANQGHKITVNESGLKFIVNLSDYVDTGLFLDHRITRSMVHDDAQGKSVLNLFAYTGSFSVYAADGGAARTTTVDLSKTYLDWAKENLAINGFSGDRHQIVQADTMQYLKDAREHGGQRFDIAVIDPPTYSNSKQTTQDWDVQQQHSQLLAAVAEILNPGGRIYFSTNFRRFKPDFSALSQFEIEEISKLTVPEDFRNRRIHRCWRMQHRIDV